MNSIEEELKSKLIISRFDEIDSIIINKNKIALAVESSDPVDDVAFHIVKASG
jgi:hypothetical protein